MLNAEVRWRAALLVTGALCFVLAVIYAKSWRIGIAAFLFNVVFLNGVLLGKSFLQTSKRAT